MFWKYQDWGICTSHSAGKFEMVGFRTLVLLHLGFENWIGQRGKRFWKLLCWFLAYYSKHSVSFFAKFRQLKKVNLVFQQAFSCFYRTFNINVPFITFPLTYFKNSSALLYVLLLNSNYSRAFFMAGEQNRYSDMQLWGSFSCYSNSNRKHGDDIACEVCISFVLMQPFSLNSLTVRFIYWQRKRNISVI